MLIFAVLARICCVYLKKLWKIANVCGKFYTFANGKDINMGKVVLKSLITIAYFFEVTLCVRDILAETYYSNMTKAMALVVISFVFIAVYVFLMYCINRLYDI